MWITDYHVYGEAFTSSYLRNSMAVISSIQAMMRSAGNNVKCNFLIVDKGFHYTRESFMVVALPETEIQIDDSLRH